MSTSESHRIGDLTRRDRATRKLKTLMMVPILISGSVSVGTSLQSTRTQAKLMKMSSTAQIKRFFIEEPTKNSGYETGPLHIVYGDGAEIVKTLPPLRASTKTETVFNAVGFSHVQLSPDGETLGWTVNVENCCTSYSIPLSLVVFQKRRVLHTFEQGHMIWDWMFVQGSEAVAVVFGPVHGSAIGDYRLYDVRTGKLKAEVWGDAQTQTLKPDAPGWAKQLEHHINHH